MIIKSVRQTFNSIPVRLNTSGDDKLVISPSSSVFEFNAVVFRVNSSNFEISPGNVAGDHLFGQSNIFLRSIDTSTNGSPAGLVVVIFRRIKDTDVLSQNSISEELTGNIYTSSTSSDDTDGGVGSASKTTSSNV